MILLSNSSYNLCTTNRYGISLVGTTICNALLLRQGISKGKAFWGTVFGFGAFNFIVLSRLIGGSSSSDNGKVHEGSSRKVRGGGQRIIGFQKMFHRKVLGNLGALLSNGETNSSLAFVRSTSNGVCV